MTLLSFKSTLPEGAPRNREERSKEKIFLEHYSWLVECALNITHGERERAEDLVHDVFLQFLDKDTDLASVADVRGYLNGILRHLHLLQLRRITRHPVHSLSLFDHDSALVGLRANGSLDLLQSLDLLVRACDFACYRKETALTASILLLRFFHGYYPGEIALLLRAKRRAVDQWVQRGRVEAKQYIESPYPLPEVDGRERKMPTAATPNAFLRLLRKRIFDSCTTDCAVLAGNNEALGVTELAHLVSCENCLQGRNGKAGLSHVAERFADDISDRDDGRPQGGGGGSREILATHQHRKASKRALLRRLYARRQERFEHRPKEISLAFDGQSHATMLVNAPSNTLNLSLAAREVPDSIAVLSEQEFRFLILDRSELTCSEGKVHRLALSDGRLLQVSVMPETLGPSIQLVYEAPLFSEKTTNADGSEPQAIDGEPILRFPSISTIVSPSGASRWRDRFLNLIPAMNPLLTSATALATVAAVCFVLWLRSAPTPSVGDLLDRAQNSDRDAVADKPSGVIYQRVAIRTSRRALERTIYRDVQGVRKPRHQQLSSQDEQLKHRLANGGVNWDAPLSAADFAAWRMHFGASRDLVTRPAPHLLTLTTALNGNGAILKETLTVRDTDFHPVDRTIELRDYGTVEIAELNYDVMPWGAVNQDLFEPLASQAVADVPRMHAALHLPRVLSDLELDEAELAVRTVLNHLHADTGESVHLLRNAAGIEIKGIVATDVRKRELLSHLAPLANVRASIMSEEEAASDSTSQPVVDRNQPIEVHSVEAEPSPLEQYLRESKLPIEQLETTSHDLLYGSLGISQAEIHFSELQPRFKEVNQLPMEQQGRLGTLSHNYLAAIEAGLDRNKRALRSLGLDGVSQARTPAVIEPGNDPDEEIAEDIHRYRQLCLELISNGTGQSRSAEEIVKDLIDVDERIRLYLAPLVRAVPGPQN